MKLNVPSGWDEVTIKQYYNLCEAMDMDWEDDTQKVIAMLSALSNVSIKDINEKVSVGDLKTYIKRISFIAGKVKESVPRPSVRVGKKRFNVDLILRDSAASSFISLSELVKTKEIANTNIHRVLAIFFHEVNWFGRRKARTVQSQKDIEAYLLEHCTMDVAFTYSGFFLTSWKNLSKATEDYLKRQLAKMAKELRKEVSRVS